MISERIARSRWPMPSLSVAGRLPFDAFAAWALKLLLPLTGVLGLGLIWAGVASFFAHDLPGPVATWSVFSELVSHPFYDAGPNDKGIGLQLMASNEACRASMGVTAW